jgi:hypothetical protein
VFVFRVGLGWKGWLVRIETNNQVVKNGSGQVRGVWNTSCLVLLLCHSTVVWRHAKGCLQGTPIGGCMDGSECA